jgi:sensor histidine kinase regulating citrate/malate metabolism
MDKRIILINEQARKILRISKDPIGEDVLKVIPRSLLPNVIETRIPLLDSEMVINNIHIMTNRIPLFHQGKIIGAVATFRDMSEIQNLAEELTEVKRYINALRAQHHEHLNHLQVISGMIQLEKYPEAENYINSMTEYQQEISDYILENIKDPGLSGLILAKIRDAEEKGIEVTLNPNTEIPPLEKNALTDIVTICGNLIQNAIDETPSRIDLFLVMTESELYIEVGDNGGGIQSSPEVDIFQAGFSTKGSARDRGIGLSLVKKLTGKRQGTVEYESSGEGSLFRVRLPAADLIYR